MNSISATIILQSNRSCQYVDQLTETTSRMLEKLTLETIDFAEVL